MKLLLINCLVCLLTFNLQQEPLSKVASIKLPANTQKISKADITDLSKTDYKRLAIDTKLKNFYKTGNVVIAFDDYERDSPVDFDKVIERTLGNGEGIQIAGTNDKMYIATYNGRKFLIHKLHKGDQFLYNFFSEPKNKKGVHGSIQFKSADLAKADAVLKDLLENIVFK